MIHFLPTSFDTVTSGTTPYAEALARLDSIRRAVGIVGQLAGDGAGLAPQSVLVAAAWPDAAPATQRAFEARSTRVAGGAAAGLEAIAAHHQDGVSPHPAALDRLNRELAAGLADLDRLLSL